MGSVASACFSRIEVCYSKRLNRSLQLYWKIAGIELTPGSKVFTARCKNLYILTTKHKITARNKIDKIKIENPFEKIITVIDNNDQIQAH